LREVIEKHYWLSSLEKILILKEIAGVQSEKMPKYEP
jgi:hypothetical protein